MPLPDDYKDRTKLFNFATPDKVRAALFQKPNTRLLDVRTDDEVLKDGRITQFDNDSNNNTTISTTTTTVIPVHTPALSPISCIGLETTPESILQITDTDKKEDITVVIYCKSGRRAEYAKSLLIHQHGYTKDNILNAGGYEDMKAILEEINQSMNE